MDVSGTQVSSMRIFTVHGSPTIESDYCMMTQSLPFFFENFSHSQSCEFKWNIFTKVQHRAFINSGCFVIQEKIHVMQDHLLLKARALRSVLRIRQWSKIVVSYMTTFKKILIKNKTNNTVGSEFQLPEQFKYQTS